MSFSKHSDSLIWELISKGDEAAFEYIYVKYVDQLFRYGQKLSKDNQLIEDSIHDVFMCLWEKRKTIFISSSLKFYLLQSMRRDVIKKINKDRKKNDMNQVDPDFLMDSSVQELLLENQIILESDQNVRKAINKLSDRQREAVFLKYMEGMSYEEVSGLMDMKVSSLYNLIMKALKNLSDFLANKQTYIKSLFYLLLFLK